MSCRAWFSKNLSLVKTVPPDLRRPAGGTHRFDCLLVASDSSQRSPKRELALRVVRPESDRGLEFWHCRLRLAEFEQSKPRIMANRCQ